MSADRPAASDGGPIGVALLGSTGSIGRQAIEILASMPDRFRIIALAGHGDVALLSAQARRLGPRIVGWTASRSRVGAPTLPPETDAIGGGDEILEALAMRGDVDLVVVATGGIVSLPPVLAALAAGKVVATANKETLVAAGHLVMRLARDQARDVAQRDPTSPFASPLAWLRPIDSEHSAIWQCLAGESMAAVDRLFLTASGGPFRTARAAELAAATPEQALRHPTWQMGPKITIDSATLANKGLEVIEAHWLYDVGYDAIEVVIHPQSVVHSAVRFVDGSLKAQLGSPDMRLPIQYALTYPERLPSPAAPVDLATTGRLDFSAPDEAQFPALRIAREAGLRGPRASAALIAADEVAVARFLAGSLTFNGIPRVLEAAVERFGGSQSQPEPDLNEVMALDAEVRAAVADPAFRSGVMAILQSIITVVIFVLMLGVLVVIHELGHFVTARAAKIRVLEFGIGFPPRARVLSSHGDTLYTLNWLPLGGFVRLEGEDGDSEDPHSFTRAPLLTKLIVLLAGVTMNLVLAFVIFTGIAWFPGQAWELAYQSVQADSPAAAAGLMSNEAIVSIDGRHFDQFDGPQPMIDGLRARAGQSVVLGILRQNGQVDQVTVTLRRPEQLDDEHGALGIMRLTFKASPVGFTRNPGNALAVGAERTQEAFRLIADGLGQIANSIATRPTEAPPASGPVGIAIQVGDVFWQAGPLATLYLAGILSANLALVNILPFPPLDGGRMLMLVIKKIAGTRLSIQAERLTYLVGFGFLFAFLIWITYFDLARIGGAVP